MKKRQKVILYSFLTLFSLVMFYPFLHMLSATFKSNEEIFSGIGLIPNEFSFSGFINGWAGMGDNTFGVFLMNSFKLVIPTVIFTIISSVVVAYGFARFNFPLKKLLFTIMLATLMLPQAVVIVPRYLLFNKLGWLDTYLPFYMPAIFATFPFFTYMLIQFIRGIPKELDEAATLDGCNSFTILTRIHLPLLKPAMFSVGIFQFIWVWNDFFNPLIYINSVDKYPLALGLRLFMDAEGSIVWNEVMAMSIVTIIPCVLLFFFAQRYFVEGISSSGLKG
ncbi:carbohydrate ABC transporter permease [Metabacillus arenae]|uniref:Carbohydrate ABC transporter permease n=1 Tax=Metabacillus arenae TaxID=2771434 RepID=A0A926NIS9_9BACI|nr:carbohydrate ABC transporter permease [Metabacillus arenae]MBD1382479.1 carbohydrate ABC transporter permease [Metabacillus arenae]